MVVAADGTKRKRTMFFVFLAKLAVQSTYAQTTQHHFHKPINHLLPSIHTHTIFHTLIFTTKHTHYSDKNDNKNSKDGNTFHTNTDEAWEEESTTKKETCTYYC